MALTQSIRDGLWSDVDTWDVRVPLDTDLTVITLGHIVDFDVDQSGFASGLVALSIHGTLRTDSSGPDRYLKINSNDIVGSGKWSIDDYADGDWPSDKQMTIDFAGGSNSINGGSGLELNFRCAEPPNQFVRLTAPASAGDRALPVDTDVTGLAALWLVGDTVQICDIDNGVNDREEHEISGISANTITIDAPGLTGAKIQGAYIFIQNRNIRIINTTDYAIESVSNSIIRAEISSVALGVQNLKGCTVGGAIVVSGLYPAFGCDGNLFSGFLTSPSFCLRLSDNNIITGSLAGSNIGIDGSYGNVMSGLIAGCNSGFEVSTGDNIITGTIIGCIRGNRGASNVFMGALLDNGIDMLITPSFSAYYTKFDGVTEFFGYADQSRAPWAYSFSVGHDQVPGAFKAWLVGGIVTHDTGIKPPGETQSYKHACESATEPVFKQDKISIPPGDTFVYAVDARKDASMSFLPRAQLLLPEEDPLVDDSNTPLDEAIMTNSIDTWEELALTYENTTNYPVEVLIRTLAMNATGNAWFLVKGGKFVAKIVVLDSTLDAVANDSNGTSVTLTITPPATGDYDDTTILFRKQGESAWDEDTFVGSQGVQGTHVLSGLDDGFFYEIAVMARSGIVFSEPSQIETILCTSNAGTIQEQIIDWLIAKLLTITTGNGYTINIRQAIRYKDSGTDLTEHPGIIIGMQSEENTNSIYPCSTGKMTLRLELWGEEGEPEVLDEKLGVIRANVQKALMSDMTANGLAHSVQVLNQENFTIEGSVRAVALMDVEINYSYLNANPYAQSVDYSIIEVGDGDFYQTMSNIEEQIVALLVAAALSGVNGIVYNNVLRSGKLLVPYLHILPQDSPILTAATTLREDIRFGFTVACIASSYSAADVNIARRIASKASSVLMGNGSLNGTVQEIRRTGYNSNFTGALPSGQVFGAGVEMETHTLSSRI